MLLYVSTIFVVLEEKKKKHTQGSDNLKKYYNQLFQMQIKSCVWKEPCSGPLAPPSGYFRQLLLGTALWPTCRVPVCPKYLPPLQLG